MNNPSEVQPTFVEIKGWTFRGQSIDYSCTSVGGNYSVFYGRKGNPGEDTLITLFFFVSIFTSKQVGYL